MESFYGSSEINHLAICLRYSIYLGWNIMSPKWINFCLFIPGETKANFLVGQLVRTDYIHCSISGMSLVTPYLDYLHLFLLYKVSLLSICIFLNHSIHYNLNQFWHSFLCLRQSIYLWVELGFFCCCFFIFLIFAVLKSSIFWNIMTEILYHYVIHSLKFSIKQ